MFFFGVNFSIENVFNRKKCIGLILLILLNEFVCLLGLGMAGFNGEEWLGSGIVGFK